MGAMVIFLDNSSSGYGILMIAVATIFSYPPDIKHQEDGLAPMKKSAQKADFFMVYFSIMKNILLSGLLLLFTYCLATFVFNPANLFDELWWLDIPMHIVGGFGTALFVYFFFEYIGKPISYLWLCISFVLVAIVWEIHEYLIGAVLYDTWFGWFDTTKDTINGWVGTTIAYYLVRK
jgi:hypothetical protein